MSKVILVVQRFSALALIAFVAIAVSSATAQPSPATTPAEASPVVSHPATTGPISHSYTLRKVDGTLNILVDPDGTWNFSGSTKAFPGKDFDVTLALKNSSGAVVLFQYVGDASHGIQFSKQGKNDILKENFASFASSHKSAWEYRLYESAAGKRAAYEAREKKREEIRKAEEEARKRHDEKVAAEKRKELKDEEQVELKWEAQQQAQQKQQQGSGGGGSSVGSVLSTIGSAIGSVLSFL
jgi:vacuolar-type H+-ATPase subunit H